MIQFQKQVLSNGLTLIHHQDNDSGMGVLNVLYRVGSKNEDPSLTGFAHLFEHLMFGGSKNAPDFDRYIQMACGENNAFTNADITNYYITLPVDNLETAFWLESDRMRFLNLNQQVLDVQKRVVIEEYKQRYVNQPYGDAWIHIRKMMYDVHSYRWPTIGADMLQIENCNLQDVATFYERFYSPKNAIIVTGGNFSFENALNLTHKWFGDLKSEHFVGPLSIPSEPLLLQNKWESVSGDVPLDAVYLAFQMVGRHHPDYHSYDILSDWLGASQSGLLYQKLVKEEKIFSDLSCFISGDVDPGLWIINGYCSPGIDPKNAVQRIKKALKELAISGISDSDLERMKNRVLSILLYGEMNLLNKVMNLALAEFLGDANLANQEEKNYLTVSRENINRLLISISNSFCGTLLYLKK